jgi:CBS domain containing-hemolysin-like protein
VVSVPGDATLSELRATVFEHGHTRYPVVDPEEEERPIGYVDVKDILRAGETNTPESTAASIARDVPMVPETTQVDDLLSELQTRQRQLALVIDEYGGLAGLVTIEDVVEVVVGEIRDEFDDAAGEPTIRRQDDGTFLVDGTVSIPVLNDRLDTDFETATYGTVGGLVLDALGRPPDPEDVVTNDGYRFDVVEVDGTRIEQVIVDPVPDADGEDDTTSEDDR